MISLSGAINARTDGLVAIIRPEKIKGASQAFTSYRLQLSKTCKGQVLAELSCDAIISTQEQDSPQRLNITI